MFSSSFSDRAFIAPAGLLCHSIGDTNGHLACVRALDEEERAYFGDSIDICLVEQADSPNAVWLVRCDEGMSSLVKSGEFAQREKRDREGTEEPCLALSLPCRATMIPFFFLYKIFRVKFAFE